MQLPAAQPAGHDVDSQPLDVADIDATPISSAESTDQDMQVIY